MCIVCHYKGDSKLVVDRGHPGSGLCVQDGACIDCGDKCKPTHVCKELPGTKAPPTRLWKTVECPKCFAQPGEKCWAKAFDKWGPMTPYHKEEPCIARRRIINPNVK